MAEVPEVRNEGQPNKYVFKNKVIDKILFANKTKDLPAITKQAIDAFPFDATYYVSSTKDEIQAFYNKYIKVSNDDIVDDDDEVKVFDSPKTESSIKEEVVSTTNENVETTDSTDINDADIESLTEDTVEEKSTEVKPVKTATESKTDDATDDEMADLLKGLDLD